MICPLVRENRQPQLARLLFLLILLVRLLSGLAGLPTTWGLLNDLWDLPISPPAHHVMLWAISRGPKRDAVYYAGAFVVNCPNARNFS